MDPAEDSKLKEAKQGPVFLAGSRIPGGHPRVTSPDGIHA